MTNPLTIQDQMRNNWFEPDGKYAFLFGMSVFDACWKKNKRTNLYEQAFADLSSVESDCNLLLKCLDKYGFKKRNVFNLFNNPSPKAVESQLKVITNSLRSGKKK